MSLEGIAKAKYKVRGRVSKLDMILVSAYNIAVKHGYTGTEEEFYSDLDSFEERAESTEQNATAALNAADRAETAEDRAEKAAKQAEEAAGRAEEIVIQEYVNRVETAVANAESAANQAEDEADRAEEAATRAEEATKDHQSDWAQNNSGTKDYVKNRPFYRTDSGEVVKLPNEYLDAEYIKESAWAGEDEVIGTATGETVTLNDSGEWPLRGLSLYGKTTQVTTTGKNLLPKSINKEILNSGVSYIVNDDGSITANGTARDGGSFVNIGTVKLEVGKTYVLSGCPSTQNGGAALYFDGTSVFDRGGGATLQADKTDYTVVIMIPGGVTVSNLTFYPMIRLASVADATYEPYTGGKPSPSPEYPQELKSVGADGTVGVTVAGKNLLNVNTVTNQVYLADGTLADNNAFVMFDFIPVKFGEVLSLSGKVIGDSQEFLRWALFDAEKAFISRHGGAAKAESAVINISHDGYIRVFIASECYDVNTLQLERNSAPTAYEPYKDGGSVIAQTPNGLLGIKLGATIPDVIANSPAHMSGVYWDEKTQAYWLCDTIDGASGKHVQRVFRYDLSKVENWNHPTGWSNSCAFYAYVPRKHIYSGYLATASMFCNRLGVSTHTVIANRQVDAISLGNEGDQLAVSILGIDSSDGLKSYFNANPTEVIYPLEVPIETDLTAEELAQYAALRTNYPNTTVFNDSGAGMSVSYVVGNKFEQMLTGMIPALEGEFKEEEITVAQIRAICT